jgi:hypothetical protein
LTFEPNTSFTALIKPSYISQHTFSIVFYKSLGILDKKSFTVCFLRSFKIPKTTGFPFIFELIITTKSLCPFFNDISSIPIVFISLIADQSILSGKFFYNTFHSFITDIFLFDNIGNRIID